MDYSTLIVLSVALSSAAFGNEPHPPPRPGASVRGGWGSDILAGLADLVASFDGILNGNPPEDDTPEDAHLGITDLAAKYGYEIEEHKVVTEDGYILTVHRLRGRKSPPNGEVVFLMHGIMESGDCWLLRGPDEALGYILADAGFDVWLGNARGNKHAAAHEALRPTDPDFWEFTWEEIGLYDLPAMIDRALEASGRARLHYVGHSQGSTAFLVLAAMRPPYNDKIDTAFALAPVAWLANVRSPLVRMISASLGFLGDFVSNTKARGPGAELASELTAAACGRGARGCWNLLRLLAGDEHNINASLLPVILGHMPAGASAAQLLHYAQLVNSGRFARFDFGAEENYVQYGGPIPPEYPVRRVRARVQLYCGEADPLATVADARALWERLPAAEFRLVRDYAHLDFLYATSVRERVYDSILLHMKERLNKTDTSPL